MQRQLGMTYRTVKQLADVATPEELFTGQRQNRPSVLDDYKPYLDDLRSEGCTNAWKLWEQIVPLGYKSGYQRVRACLHVKRTSPQPVSARPTPRTVAGWILCRPDTRTEPGQLQPSLHTLAAGIDRGRDAVIAGLTLHGIPGTVEGHANRIKMPKRRMFGRAGFSLLRKRVSSLREGSCCCQHLNGSPLCQW
ncbi:hypothetical protein ACFFTQ_00015 [Streptomyces roseofulvus]|uniref:hypothetical protein n=1 Tax=Streptomyces roseofulvus TaxID=33902 RepID=UPI0031FD0E34